MEFDKNKARYIYDSIHGVEEEIPYPEKYRKNNKHKIYARSKVFIALRNGKIKKDICQVCGDTKVEAHHNDYKKPLEIIWLCKKHHIEFDKQLKNRHL